MTFFAPGTSLGVITDFNKKWFSGGGFRHNIQPAVSTEWGASKDYFGHKDYEKNKQLGLSDQQILRHLDKNPGQLRGGNVKGGGGLYDEIYSKTKGKPGRGGGKPGRVGVWNPGRGGGKPGGVGAWIPAQGGMKREGASQTSSGQLSSNTSGFQGVSGSYLNQGLGNLVDIGNKYADNETIGGLVAGSMIDVAKTQAQTGLALGYQEAFLGSLANYQGGLENLRTGNTMKLMSAEGGIAKDLMNTQGGWGIKGIQETGTQQRAGIAETGKQTRLNTVTAGEQQRLGTETAGRQQRFGIQTTGQEERKNIAERTRQQQRLRADARGAIRSAGSRFFG
jgi:hypothetical protein